MKPVAPSKLLNFLLSFIKSFDSWLCNWEPRSILLLRAGAAAVGFEVFGEVSLLAALIDL